MKRITNLLFCLMSCMVFSQTTILFEDFEDPELTYATSITDDLTDIEAFDYFGRINETSGLPASVSYGNAQGLGFYGVQDFDGTASGDIEIVELNWTNIDVGGFTNLNLSWFVAEDDATDGNEDWDATTSVRLEVQIDGGGYFTVFAIESSNVTGLNLEPLVDTDFDGVGDGQAISDVFTQFNIDLASGTVLDIRLVLQDLDTGDEDIAFDNLLLIGDAGDNTPPGLVENTPNTNATEVPIDAVLIATFSEPVQWQADALPSIFIRNLETGVQFAAFEPASTEVVFDGNNMILDPIKDFELGQKYVVTISSGALQDAEGNKFDGLLTTDWTFTIIVPEDNEAPEITCPDAVIMSTEEDSCEASFPLLDPTATDNISEAFEFEGMRNDNLDLTDPFLIGETTITWTAIDEAGNRSEPCVQTITVNDEQAPVIICGPDISIVGSAVEVVTITQPTVTDNCTTEPLVTFVRSDDATLTLEDPFPQGTTTITWTVLDDNNNRAICTQTVTIGMELSMANDIANFGIPTQLPGTDIDPNEKTVNLFMPLGTDLTGLVPNIAVSAGAIVSPQTGVAQDFSSPVIYAVTAEDGTIQEWTIIVQLEEDTEPPVVECPEDIMVSNDPGECGAFVEFEPTATDNSGSVTVSADFMSGGVFPVGTTLVTVTATDASGNNSTCSFNVTVTDNEFPKIVCKDITIPLDEGGLATILQSDILESATDNCGISLISVSPLSFGTESIGDNEVEVTVVDDNGNASSCVANVTILPFELNELSVTSFTLINADTDEPIRDLVEGGVIDINDLPTLHLDIRANTTESVESVRLSLDGALTTSRTESLMPFALFRDLPLGDYIGEDFVIGNYTVSATPYSEDELRGNVGTPFSLNFELVDSTPTLSVRSFTLINAETDEPLFDLTEGQQIDINSLPTTNLDIRANTTDDVESVRISISGELMNERTESLLPYALFQDLPIGDYMGEEFTVGAYTVSAIPYSGNSLGGDVGTPLALNFELVDGNAACASLAAEADVVNPTTCSGGGSITIIPSGGTAPYEVAWITVSFTGETLDGITAGPYSATVTDADGCSIIVNAEIEDPELPEVTLEPFADILDTDLPLVLSGGMPEGGEYSGEGVTAGIFEPGAPGIYEITYTYENPVTECSNSATQEIVVKAENFNNIVAYWLVNADNEMDLFPITDGMQIDISTLPTTNLDIRAETGTDTESVGFTLSGTQSIMRGESVPPYALFQDLPIGDYIGHEFDLGEYTLSGTPYTQNNLKGDAGETLTIDFEFVDSTPTMAVTGFTLIDAENNSELFELSEGMQITINDIPSLFLDIRANTTDDVESVRLELSGQQSSARTESLVPYALFRDLPIGDYIGNNFEFGIYTVTATPYSGNNLSGETGTPLSITFEIVDNPELNTLTISPNQASTLARASFKRPTEVKQILIFDMSGRMIESYNPKYIKSGDDYILDVNFYQQGSYIVKMIDSRGTPYQKQMVVKR